MSDTYVPHNNDSSAAFHAIVQAQAAGRELVSVTITDGAHAGKRYLSNGPGKIDGAIAPELDAQAAELAEQVWTTRTTVFAPPLFAELHAVAEPLLIFGAGHIAVPLANLAQTLGFRVTVLDDRTDFAQPARFHEGIDVRALDFAQPLARINLAANTFVVLVTRAHKYDFDCLRAVLSQSELPRYIGMIGSKRRVRAAFQALLTGGVPRALLARVHAPVGVEIGAETPAEIAVSIAAELIQVRRQQTGGSKLAADRVLERMFPENAAQ
ncbi:MAG TPA: XdhC family protein [Longimicrobiales bacterium]|nr:XdhC family protein [Longimicrobiales bacterium]